MSSSPASPAPDPRKANCLREAALNPDGTWNGPRALSWLTEALSPGKGLSEEEVRKLAEDTIRASKGTPSRGRP